MEEISRRVDVKFNTLKTAIQTGRILLPESTLAEKNIPTKSQRSVIDSNQGMGKACINTIERVLACKTGQSCTIKFDNQVDLTHAGVLLSLPALLANGLLKYKDEFTLDWVYYPVESIFICLAFLALLRVKTLAQSSSIPSGELGKAIGLDRAPEVKTLRERIALFCDKANVELWASKLSKDWMEDFPELSGVLYIDGHVNIYHGQVTQMPKRYVSRLRLCMSGSTDYWVNDMTGQPFFVVNKVINGSMIQVIKEEIIPRLNQDVPNQPSEEELINDESLCRFMLVFDRECYSPDFFHDLWQERISICTYNKNVKDKWSEEEFQTYYYEASPGSEVEEIELAERGVLLQSKGSKKKVWAREVRKKSKTGHQTSILTTNFILTIIQIGIYMFSRWSQENFFRYMMENFGIDTLVSYIKEKISDTSTLVNPRYRELENSQRKLTSKLNTRKTKFATLELGSKQIEEKEMKKYLAKKSELRDEIMALESEILEIKQAKEEIPRKITFAELPENEKFTNAINHRKYFLDIIKMISYRAETAMANIIKRRMSHPDEARILLKQIYKSDANIYPNYENKVLNIEIHRMTFWKDDKVLEYLCNELNQTKTKFPGTDLTIIYKLVSD